MPATATRRRVPLAEHAGQIVERLETVESALDDADQLADELFHRIDRGILEDNGDRLRRFRWAIYEQARHVRDDLAEDHPSEFEIDILLREARELHELITLSTQGGGSR